MPLGFFAQIAANALGTLVAAAVLYLVTVLSGAIEPRTLLVVFAGIVGVVGGVWVGFAVVLAYRVEKYGQWPFTK